MLADQGCVHDREEVWFSSERSRLVDVDDWRQPVGAAASRAWARESTQLADLLPFPDHSGKETVSDRYRKNLEVAQLLALWEEQGTDEDIARWEEFEAELEAARLVVLKHHAPINRYYVFESALPPKER